MKARIFLSIMASLALAAPPTIVLAAAAPPAELHGGPTTIPLPSNPQPGFPIKNETGVPICDFIIEITAGSISLNGAHVSDPHQNSEDWDVDDNANGSLEAGESGTGVGAEGAGGAALGHADNTLPAPGRSVRTQETNYDNCIRPGRTASLTLSFTGTPNNGDTVTVQPTNSRGANIFGFTDGALGLAELWDLREGFHLNAGFGAFASAADSMITNMTLVIQDAVPLWVESNPPSLVDYTMDEDGIAWTVNLYFEPPISGDDGVTIDGELSDFGSVIVHGQGYDTAPADDDGDGIGDDDDVAISDDVP